MKYPVIVDCQDSGHSVGIVVPDIPGCFSAGDTVEEALENTKEAIVYALEDYFEKALDIPKASSLDEIVKKYPKKSIALVEVNFSNDTARVNITVPKRLLEIIDIKAKKNNQTRSSYLIDRAL